MNKLRTAALAALIALNAVGCKKSESHGAQKLYGSASAVFEYLQLKGQGPCMLLRDRDFDGDGINDAYVQSRRNPDVIYHTNSSDFSPTSEQEITWHLRRE